MLQTRAPFTTHLDTAVFVPRISGGAFNHLARIGTVWGMNLPPSTILFGAACFCRMGFR